MSYLIRLEIRGVGTRYVASSISGPLLVFDCIYARRLDKDEAVIVKHRWDVLMKDLDINAKVSVEPVGKVC